MQRGDFAASIRRFFEGMGLRKIFISLIALVANIWIFSAKPIVEITDSMSMPRINNSETDTKL